jgi:hypothetical protein
LGSNRIWRAFDNSRGADVGGSGQHDQLLGLTVFVARDSGLNGIDLKHRGDRRDPEFLLDRVPRLRAALRRCEDLSVTVKLRKSSCSAGTICELWM